MGGAAEMKEDRRALGCRGEHRGGAAKCGHDAAEQKRLSVGDDTTVGSLSWCRGLLTGAFGRPHPLIFYLEVLPGQLASSR